MHVYVSILLLLINLQSVFAEICPDFIVCKWSGNKDSCPENQFYKERVKVNGCCPGCVPLKDEYENCEISDECQRGLFCGPKKRCEKDPSQECEFYKRNNSIWKKTQYWNPVCLNDGSYAPKQCKGEKLGGKCFCVDSKGKRIFGEKEWSKADKMTCGCSRLMSKLSEKKRTASFHCDEAGNFEALQCEGGVCWCASPTTGLPYTTLLPVEMMAFLPCHNKDVGGAQYYRKCDSERQMQERIKELLQNHGTRTITFAPPNCNYDGSYSRVQTSKERIRCAYINNDPLTEAVAMGDANCNCAYDRHVYQMNRVPFLFDCLPNGNYAPRQIWNGKIYCVDSDGFCFSEDSKDCPLDSEGMN